MKIESQFNIDKNLAADVKKQAILALTALDDKKAQDLVCISLLGKSPVADSLVIATATSNTHARALLDAVLKAFKENGLKIKNIEGEQVGEWVILDTGDIMVHIFQEDAREKYRLEKLWAHNFDLDTTHDEDSLKVAK